MATRLVPSGADAREAGSAHNAETNNLMHTKFSTFASLLAAARKIHCTLLPLARARRTGRLPCLAAPDRCTEESSALGSPCAPKSIQPQPARCLVRSLRSCVQVMHMYRSCAQCHASWTVPLFVWIERVHVHVVVRQLTVAAPPGARPAGSRSRRGRPERAKYQAV
eukprot:SAG22_NODE_49_length_24620_cov_80.053587_20_plen_166_part_00